MTTPFLTEAEREIFKHLILAKTEIETNQQAALQHITDAYKKLQDYICDQRAKGYGL